MSLQLIHNYHFSKQQKTENKEHQKELDYNHGIYKPSQAYT